MTKRTTNPLQPNVKMSTLISEFRNLQRRRAWYLKTRNMLMNRLRATVAMYLGYQVGSSQTERERKFAEATAFIKNTTNGEADVGVVLMVELTRQAIQPFEDQKPALEKEMERLAKLLPVAAWVGELDQKGFGFLNLAIIIGEAGDLAGYANPGKLWKRFGCAPIEHDGKLLMPSTWRAGKSGKLPKEVWEAAGYSPRRRSVAFNVAEPLLKNNYLGRCYTADGQRKVPGPYRKRYDDKKAEYAEKHSDWSSQKGFKLRCHLHGLLLTAKLLLKNLWIQWNETGDTSIETETSCARHKTKRTKRRVKPKAQVSLTTQRRVES